MRFRNMTGRHVIVGGVVFRTEGHATVERQSPQLSTMQTDLGSVVVMTIPAFGPVIGLPPETAGVGLIVSAIVAEALRGSGRRDIFVAENRDATWRSPAISRLRHEL